MKCCSHVKNLKIMSLKLTIVLLSDMFIVFEWVVLCGGNAVRCLSGGIHLKSAL